MNSKTLGICVVGNFDMVPPGLKVMRFLACIVIHGIPTKEKF